MPKKKKRMKLSGRLLAGDRRQVDRFLGRIHVGTSMEDMEKKLMDLLLKAAKKYKWVEGFEAYSRAIIKYAKKKHQKNREEYGWIMGGLKKYGHPSQNPRRRGKRPSPIETMTKKEEEFIYFLQDTLIPDLKESGYTATAEDFEDGVRYALEPHRGGSLFVRYLKETLIPDLRESGRTSTAGDLAVLSDLIVRQMKRHKVKFKKNPEFVMGRGCIPYPKKRITAIEDVTVGMEVEFKGSQGHGLDHGEGLKARKTYTGTITHITRHGGIPHDMSVTGNNLYVTVTGEFSLVDPVTGKKVHLNLKRYNPLTQSEYREIQREAESHRRVAGQHSDAGDEEYAIAKYARADEAQRIAMSYYPGRKGARRNPESPQDILREADEYWGALGFEAEVADTHDFPEPKSPGEFAAWFADESKVQETQAKKSTGEERQWRLKKAKAMRSYVARLIAAGVKPVRLDWKNKRYVAGNPLTPDESDDVRDFAAYHKANVRKYWDRDDTRMRDWNQGAQDAYELVDKFYGTPSSRAPMLRAHSRMPNPPAYFVVDPRTDNLLYISRLGRRRHMQDAYKKAADRAMREARRLGYPVAVVVHPYVPQGWKQGVKVKPIFYHYGAILYDEEGIIRGNPLTRSEAGQVMWRAGHAAKKGNRRGAAAYMDVVSDFGPDPHRRTPRVKDVVSKIKRRKKNPIMADVITGAAIGVGAGLTSSVVTNLMTKKNPSRQAMLAEGEMVPVKNPLTSKEADYLFDQSQESYRQGSRMEDRGHPRSASFHRGRGSAQGEISTAFREGTTITELLKNPGMSRAARQFISDEIGHLVRKGYGQKQAIAAAYSMARKKGFKVPRKNPLTEAEHRQIMKSADWDGRLSREYASRGNVEREAYHKGRKLRGKEIAHNFSPRTRLNPAEVAQTILQQMGGPGRLKAMIGAHSVFARPDGVSFKWKSRAKGRLNYLNVTLDPNDTYTMEFGRVWRSRGVPTYTKKKVLSDIYWDQLIPIFESETGLYLRLNNPGRGRRGARKNPILQTIGMAAANPPKQNPELALIDFEGRPNLEPDSLSDISLLQHLGWKSGVLPRKALARLKKKAKSKGIRVYVRKARKRRTRKNPPEASYEIPFKEGQKIPVEKARAWVQSTGDQELIRQFEEAYKLQSEANRPPKHVIWKMIQMGDPNELESVQALVQYGETDETMYKAPKGSKKGSHLYVHEWGEGSGKRKPVPLLAAPGGKALIMPLGSGQVASDWLRG